MNPIVRTVAIKLLSLGVSAFVGSLALNKLIEMHCEEKVNETLYYINKYGMTKKELIAKEKAEKKAKNTES